MMDFLVKNVFNIDERDFGYKEYFFIHVEAFSVADGVFDGQLT